MITSARSRDDSVTTITLDRPERRNALSTTLLTQLLAYVESACADERNRAIVLTASGRAFCAGADLTDPPDAQFPALFQKVLTTIMEAPLPVIARVAGHVRAGGIGLIAACDVAICSDDVTFGFSEVRVGVVPAFVAVLARRLMGARAVQELILTGRPFAASEALGAGLLTSVVEPTQLDSAVEGVLDEFGKADADSVGRAKRLLRDLDGRTEADGFLFVANMSAAQFGSPTAKSLQGRSHA